MLKLKEPITETKKLKLGHYPYTYVRTVVMRSLLFRKDDYHRMLKMSFSEIAKFLQESHYKKEINELATQYSGADLLELALNKNLADSFKKLMRISSEELGFLIREYAKRKDIDDLKTIIRGKFTNADEKNITGSLTGAGTLSYDFLVSLLKKESIEEVLKANRLIDFSLLKGSLKDFNEKNNLVSIENSLDKYYYGHLIKFSEILPKEGDLFRNFLLKEVEILNILTLLRFKKAKSDKESIKDFIIPSGDKLKDSKMMAMAGLDDLEQLSKSLEKTEYKNLIASGIEEFKKSDSLISLETELYKYLLKQAVLFMHQHPLSIDVILGYMFSKDIEVRNLKIIIKGKQLGLKEEFMESQLIH
ncbi:ATP synthase A1 subunit C [Candidatus Woesearchaeota archaeon]|jgi:V/A-type H+-transporting ATPase subunit C|nr:ATP synthase A1 subunit C [Candidatus Woesearchaeota archaeon]MDP6648107.1 ATP synthase A1 subunit C [Candidatus Woesearchaeota archaeon]|tara:strand:- start:61581 stop:62663 length:1083 start_codon:yes stop_codon:yes gene_type:complete